MSNGEVCCILGVCCPAGSEAQREALVHELQKQRPHLPMDRLEVVADKILKQHKNFASIAETLDAEG